MPAADQLDRAYGALAGLALGDALGMPTQSFTRAQVQERFGVVTELLPGPADQPIAPGLPAGSITDDTEQAMLLADELLTGRGLVDARRWAAALDAWERRMAAKGSRDLLGPSTKAAIDAIRGGADPAEAGRLGTTNGAAMRVAPVGIATAWGARTAEHERFVDRVVLACLPTHHTSLAISAACAVAAVVSYGIGQGSGPGSTAADDGWQPVALEAARLGAQRGNPVTGPSVAARIAWVLATPQADRTDEWIADVVGTTVASQESVPAAFALLPAALADPLAGLGRAASLGGDTDTVGAMLGAMTGALLGRSRLPGALCDRVESGNGLDLRRAAADLLTLRAGSAPSGQGPR